MGMAIERTLRTDWVALSAGFTTASCCLTLRCKECWSNASARLRPCEKGTARS